MPDWEQALGPLIAQPGITPSTNGIPLALQFEVEEPAPHFSYTGRRDPLRSVRQLKARPVIMGAKGKWIRGDVSWNTLSYLNYRRECNEAHVEWMQEFLAVPHRPRQPPAQLHRALAGAEHLRREEPVEPAGPGPEDRRRPGPRRGQEPVRFVEEPAAVGLNLTRFGVRPDRRPDAAVGADAASDDGGLKLAPTITVEGEVVDPAPWGPSAARRTGSS